MVVATLSPLAGTLPAKDALGTLDNLAQRINHEHTAEPRRSVASLSATDARTLTDQVKADAQALWAKLLDLYVGGAHLVLDYSSWGGYCAAEFGMSDGRAYQ